MQDLMPKFSSSVMPIYILLHIGFVATICFNYYYSENVFFLHGGKFSSVAFTQENALQFSLTF
jgi:hypothetical protein